MSTEVHTFGKLSEISFPEEFPVVSYYCEKKYKTSEDMQFHDHYEFGLCLEGQGVFFIGNQMIPFMQGNVSMIPPGLPHFAQSLDAHPSKWLFVAVEKSIAEASPRKVISNVVFDKPMEQVIQLIAEELEKRESNYKRVVSELIDILFLRGARIHNDQPSFFSYGKGVDAVYPAIGYITRNYPEKMTIEELADMCNLSLTHFRRRFKNVTNATPLEYLMNVRLRMASVFLRLTDRKISDISLDVGYNTLSSFNRHFKQHYNMSPKDYRASARTE